MSALPQVHSGQDKIGCRRCGRRRGTSRQQQRRQGPGVSQGDAPGIPSRQLCVTAHVQLIRYTPATIQQEGLIIVAHSTLEGSDARHHVEL